MKLRLNGKVYKVKQIVWIRLQGIALILLGCLCYGCADGAALFFWGFGGLMLCPDIGKFNRLIYNAAKRIVRIGRDTIYYNK